MISGLNRTAFDLAVYASQGWSPTIEAKSRCMEYRGKRPITSNLPQSPGKQLGLSPSHLAGTLAVEGRQRGRTGLLKPSDESVARAHAPSPQPSPAREERARSYFDPGCSCSFNGIGAKASVVRAHWTASGKTNRLLLLPWHRRSSYEPDAPARGVPQSPRWRVGLVCARMRNFLAGVIRSCPQEESKFQSLSQDSGNPIVN